MSGNTKIGLFLVVWLLFGGWAWADGKPAQGPVNPYPEQVDSWHETGVNSGTSFSESLDVVAYEKEAAAEVKTMPAGTAPAKLMLADAGPVDTSAEGGKIQDVKPEDVKPGDVKSEDVKPGDAKPEDVKPGENETEDVSDEGAIADPIEPINRAMFVFNDKLYFWFLKPVARGYNAIVPEVVRVSVRNFFRNAAMPLRFVNCLLQGKFEGAGIELVRFGVNTTVGIAGFLDIAKDHFDLTARNEDLGQTFGLWGMGGLMYIVWPFIGPSTVRDTIGLAGDSFMDPLTYVNPFEIPLGIRAYERINNTSLELGSYEDITSSALDPYIAVKDAFIQHRKSQIKR